MDRRPTCTDCDEAGDYVVPNVLSQRDLVFRPDNMDETVPHTTAVKRQTVLRLMPQAPPFDHTSVSSDEIFYTAVTDFKVLIHNGTADSTNIRICRKIPCLIDDKWLNKIILILI